MTTIEIIGGLFAFVLIGTGFWFRFRNRTFPLPRETDQESIAPTKPEDVFAQLPATMQDRLGKTRSTFATTLVKLRGKSTVDPSFWVGIEEMLLLSDVGINTTEFICEEAKKKCDEKKVATANEALDLVREVLLSIFQSERAPIIADKKPNVWLFVGVNGVGKTTSIAKIAHHYRNQDRSVLMVAGDTFRAAAADQLETWATRTGADIVRSNEGADPASVVFDGMEKANAKQYEIVLVDTAGRLHTKSNLMEEIKKIRRVVDRTQGALKEVLIVIDASTGQNGLVQAREFGEALGVTGVVLSKLDGSAKGGIVLAIEHELGVPIKWVGLGEGAGDLVPFEPKEYVDALIS